MATLVQELLPRAWYSATAADFRAAAPTAVLGALAANSDQADEPEQRGAWIESIEALQSALGNIPAWIAFEFAIPRMGHRADAVVLVGAAVFVVEFKQAERFAAADSFQVWDYALELKHFHRASHDLPIVPILVATGAKTSPGRQLRLGAGGVYEPVLCAASELGDTFRALSLAIGGPAIDAARWMAAPYYPTPTIVEAALSLFAGHGVAEIARSEAHETDLKATTDRLEAIAAAARREGRKAIAFVTGVPGAGKTLIGLGLATRQPEPEIPHAVYLSGNGPLVAVLRAALLRDCKAKHGPSREQRLLDQTAVKKFIQNVHHFRDEALRDPAPYAEHVVVFDEAQRAWNHKQLAGFMQRRKGRKGFTESEPEFLIASMDRHRDWAAVICLVGNGQEINRGEAGIAEWLEALSRMFPAWQVHLPATLEKIEPSTAGPLARLQAERRVTLEPALHLAASVRSHRAERLATLIQAILESDTQAARQEMAALREYFPLVVTRELAAAKDWVRVQAGPQRCGLLATSKALRLKPLAIDQRVKINPVHYFLNGRADTRSSFYLEDAASEFDAQGLELDWSLVAWDADLRRDGGGWKPFNFRGSRWQNINKPWDQLYARNAYRVLLTRARFGMAIFVPPGNAADATRRPDFYDATFDYLAQEIGMPTL